MNELSFVRYTSNSITKKSFIESPQEINELFKKSDIQTRISIVEEVFLGKSLEVRYFKEGYIHVIEKPDDIAPLIRAGFLLQYNGTIFYLTRGLLGGGPSLVELEHKLETKRPEIKSVFISYQWDQQELAKDMQAKFEKKGYLVIRDTDWASPGVNIEKFMELIKHPNMDYCIVIVNSSYLESENCMNEARCLMQRHKFKKTMLTCVVESGVNQKSKSQKAEVYGTHHQIARWKFWDDKVQDARLANAKADIIEKLELCRETCHQFVGMLPEIINANETQLMADDYKIFFDKIEARESRNEYTKVKEINNLLFEIEGYRKQGKPAHGTVEELFKTVFEKLHAIMHIKDRDIVCANVHNAYAAFLVEGEHYLEAITNAKTAMQFNPRTEEFELLLKQIDFSKVLGEEHAKLLKEIEMAPPLSSLTLKKVQITNADLLQWNFSRLQSISLLGCKGLDDEIVQQIVEQAPDVYEINLSGSHLIFNNRGNETRFSAGNWNSRWNDVSIGRYNYQGINLALPAVRWYERGRHLNVNKVATLILNDCNLNNIHVKGLRLTHVECKNNPLYRVSICTPWLKLLDLRGDKYFKFSTVYKTLLWNNFVLTLKYDGPNPPHYMSQQSAIVALRTARASLTAAFLYYCFLRLTH